MVNRVKILLVDDVRMSLEIGKDILKNKGCEIITVSNGKEAFETARTERPDMVITDLYMPGMNGDELCMAIKSDPALGQVPVLLMTVIDNRNSQDKCREARCDDIIKKPFEKAEMLDKVSRFLPIVCRQHPRIPVNYSVTYGYNGQSYTGSVKDISNGGMFVSAKQLLPIGSDVSIKVDESSLPTDYDFSGKVVRVVNNSTKFPFGRSRGMGVEFEAPADDAVKAMALLMEEPKK